MAGARVSRFHSYPAKRSGVSVPAVKTMEWVPPPCCP